MIPLESCLTMIVEVDDPTLFRWTSEKDGRKQRARTETNEAFRFLFNVCIAMALYQTKGKIWRGNRDSPGII